MRRSERNVPFNLAVKHLFRHLDDPRRLRCNPIVQRFFGDPATADEGWTNDQAALGLIRRLVRQAAEEQKQLGVDAGDTERALLQYRIVIASCFEGKPMTAVAKKLAMSLPQCYRERAEIYRRIARSIQTGQRVAVTTSRPTIDGFRFLLNLIEVRGHTGDLAGALAEYDTLANTVGVAQKIEVLCRCAKFLIDSGESDGAWLSYRSAESLLVSSADFVAENTAALLRTRLRLVHANLLWRSGAVALASESYAQIAADLDRIRAAQDAMTEDVYAQALLYAGKIASVYWPNFREAFANLSRADAACRRATMPSPIVGAEIALWLCKFRDCLVSDAEHWKPERERLEAFADAGELACSTGSLELAAGSFLALVRHYSELGDAAKTLEAASSLMTLLGSQQVPYREHFALLVARSLLYTSNWRYAARVLQSFPNLDRLVAGSHRGALKLVRALGALRCGDYRRAWQVSRSHFAESTLAGTARAELQLVAAEVAFALERRPDAVACVEDALSKAEAIGSAWLLKETYRVAALVTGYERFCRKAEEAARALRA